MSKLIILRGNSGSGKTSVAKALQRRFGRNTMVISQELDGFSLRLFGNLVGNIILFIPLGIMLPAVKDGFQKFYICIPVICVFSLFVEMIQYLTRSGSADIDDMILNTVGGLIGFTLYKIVSQMIRTGRRSSSSG